MTGRPKGRQDNPLNNRKQGTETEEEKNARIQKTVETQKNKKAEAAQQFFQPLQRAAKTPDQNKTADGINADNLR